MVTFSRRNRSGCATAGTYSVQAMPRMTPSLAAICAHTSSAILPVGGPALVLIASWHDQYAREHSAIALLLSSSVTAVVFIGSELAAGGLVFLVLPLVVLTTLAALNIQRVHRGEPPLLRG